MNEQIATAQLYDFHLHFYGKLYSCFFLCLRCSFFVIQKMIFNFIQKIADATEKLISRIEKKEIIPGTFPMFLCVLY